MEDYIAIKIIWRKCLMDGESLNILILGNMLLKDIKLSYKECL